MATSKPKKKPASSSAKTLGKQPGESMEMYVKRISEVLGIEEENSESGGGIVIIGGVKMPDPKR